MARTYSPLPAWPVTAAASVLWLLPNSRPRLPIAALIGGYVAGPLLGTILHAIACRVDDAMAELPDIDD